jgi:hypothetical protein
MRYIYLARTHAASLAKQAGICQPSSQNEKRHSCRTLDHPLSKKWKTALVLMRLAE